MGLFSSDLHFNQCILHIRNFVTGLQGLWEAFIIFHSCTCPCTTTHLPCVVTVSRADAWSENNRWTIHPSPNAASRPWGVVLNLFSVKWERVDGRRRLGPIIVLSHPIPALNLDTLYCARAQPPQHTLVNLPLIWHGCLFTGPGTTRWVTVWRRTPAWLDWCAPEVNRCSLALWRH